MNEIMRLVFMQVKEQLDARFGCFEILSFDFLLKEGSLAPQLIDIGADPVFTLDMNGNSKVLRLLLRDICTMVIDIHEPGHKKAFPDMVEKALKCAF